MEKSETIFKQHLLSQTDEELFQIYSKELTRENNWDGVSPNCFHLDRQKPTTGGLAIAQ